MKHLKIFSVTFILLWASVLGAGQKVTKPYDIVDANYLPYVLDLASTVKLLPKALRPAGKIPYRCLVLRVELRLAEGDFVPIYFDRFSLSFSQDGATTAVPAVGVGLGPLPLKAGDPEEKWQDRWEIGKAKGTFSLIGGDPSKTSRIKVLFLVPQDVTEVTLMQKDAGGKPTVAKAGILITEEKNIK